MEQYGRSISLSHQPREENENTSDESSDDITPAGALITGGDPSSRPTRSITPASYHLSSGAAAGEVTNRKPRGRPPGSKNKPKPPVIITRETDSGSMKPVVLEISPGTDIIGTVVEFARRRHVGITILSGSGTVSTVGIQHIGSRSPPLTMHGPFNLLSLTGTYLGYHAPPQASLSSSCFAISLAGIQGQMFGGIVTNKAIAGSQVVLVGSTFLNPTFHHLPAEFEQPDREIQARSGGGGGGSGGHEGCSTAMSMSIYGVGAAPVNEVSPDRWGASTSRLHY
ncbi:hypothetical protein LguiA_021475 [Lonicera macranthoides]